MTAERAALEGLIESVADGSPIDWQELESGTWDEDARRRVRDLRLVAGVAAVHRAHTDAELVDNLSGLPHVDDGLERWGHLILLEKIGEGSFGAVYRARDPWLDREVALKLLKPSATGDVLIGSGVEAKPSATGDVPIPQRSRRTPVVRLWRFRRTQRGILFRVCFWNVGRGAALGRGQYLSRH